MKNLKLLISLIAATFVYCYLMWYQSLGLNAFVFASLLIAGLLVYKREIFLKRQIVVSAAAFLISSVGVVITGIMFSKVIYFITMLLFLAFVQMPSIKSPMYAGLYLPFGLVCGVGYYFMLFVNSFKDVFGTSKSKNKYAGSILIASMLVLVFFLIFMISNSHFANLVSKIVNPLTQILSINGIGNVFHYLFNLFFIALFFYVYKQNVISEADAASGYNYTRKKNILFSKRLTLGLKREYKTAMFSIAAINVMLLVLNLIDVFTVWLGIVPENAAELSKMVHSGTYSLIFSTLLSMAVLLYFFRENINDYPNSKTLKTLSYVWVAQNVFLLLSVALRNYHYVREYGLTYKRIGVFLFLIVVIVSLYFLYTKIRSRKTQYYFLGFSEWGAIALFVIAGLVNWETVICEYNTKYAANKDLAYLYTLSEQAYPYTYESSILPEEVSHGYIGSYIEEVEGRDWQSFNFGDYFAVKKLKK